MSQLASVALQVNDLETSLHFFVDLLGFPLQERHPDGERALLLDLTGTPLLLAGPRVQRFTVVDNSDFRPSRLTVPTDSPYDH